MKVLLVEDNDGHIDLIRSAFERSSIDYDLKIAKSFQEVEKILKKYDFDVSIVDYMLPDSRGNHITYLAEKHFPVIVMTAYGGEREAVESIKAGAIDYISKSSDSFISMPQLAQKAIIDKEMMNQKKEAEIALRESENKFKMVADNAPFPIILTSLDGEILYVNYMGEQLFEAKFKQDAKIDDYYLDISQRKTIKDILIKDKIVHDYEIQLKTHKGRIFWAQVSGRFEEFDNKKCILVQLRDITEIKKAQDNLRKNEELLRLIIDAAKDAIFIKDTSLRYVRINKAMEELFGKTSEEILWHKAIEIFPQETSEEIENVEKKVLKGEVIEEYTERPIKGEIRYFHTVKVPLKDATGMVFGLCGIARDISVRKKMEDALRKSEEIQSLLTSNMIDIVSLIDAYDNVLYITPSIKQDLGWNVEDIINQKAISFLHPDDKEKVVKIQHNAVDNFLSDFRIEYRFKHKNGYYLWFESVCRILYENKAYAGLILGSRNIDQRKKAEESLKRREKILEGIAEASQKLLSSSDLDGALKETLQMLCEGSGVDRVCIIEKVKNRKSNEQRLNLVYEWAKPDIDTSVYLKESKNTVYDTFCSRWMLNFEEGRTVKGKIRDFPNAERSFLSMYGIKSLLAAPILVGGNLWGFIAFESFAEERFWSRGEEAAVQTAAGSIAAAISRKKAEDDLKKGEERFRITIENAPFAILIFDFDGIVLYANKRVMNLFGCEANDIIGKKMASRIWSDTVEYEKWMNEIKKKEQLKDIEAVFSDLKKTRKIICITSGIVIDYMERKAVLAAYHDLSDRKRAEEDRLNLERQIQHTQRQDSLGVLAGGIAHDFNNLLGVILGYADLAQLKISEDDPVNDDLKEIINASTRASDLCRQMLTYSGKGKIHVCEFDLLKLISETSNLLKALVSKKAILEVSLPENLPLIEADPSQIDQILINMVVNASEALENNVGTIRISLYKQRLERTYLDSIYLGKGLPEGEYVCLRVSDTGKGMDKETIDRVFEPFYSTKSKSRGLGLSVVIGIVKSHKGAMDIRSVSKEGTSFSVFFPAIKQKKKKAVKDIAKRPKKWKGSGLALVADDENSVLEMCKEMLEYLGFEVLVAYDGRSAVEIYKKNCDKIRIIILDLIMPNMDGEEAFEEIHKINPDAKIIISSGYGELQVSQRFADRKMDAFIQKPYQVEKLRDILSSVLG